MLALSHQDQEIQDGQLLIAPPWEDLYANKILWGFAKGHSELATEDKRQWTSWNSQHDMLCQLVSEFSWICKNKFLKKIYSMTTHQMVNGHKRTDKSAHGQMCIGQKHTEIKSNWTNAHTDICTHLLKYWITECMVTILSFFTHQATRVRQSVHHYYNRILQPIQQNKTTCISKS